MGFLKFISLAALLALMTPRCDARSKDVTVEYFASVMMTCEDDDGNVVDSTAYQQIFWITAEALAVYDDQQPDLPSYIKLHNITHLEVTRVNDDQFGYYTCVMIENASSHKPRLMRWGVNIDGADYSKLEEQYKDSAVIGAVAAAVMLVLVGGGCIIWHYRYSNRLPENGRSSIEEDPKQMKLYQNQGFDSTTEMTETKIDANGPEEKPNGTTSNDGGVVDARM